MVNARLDKINRYKAYIILAIIVILVALIPVFSKTYFVSTMISIFLFAIYALSYDLLIGYVGIASFGHSVFFGLGAYAVAICTVKLGLSFITGLVAGIIVSAILAVILGLITIKVKSIYFNLTTMGISELLYVLACRMTNITGGDEGLQGVKSLFTGKEGKLYMYYICAALLGLTYLFCYKLVRSNTGKIFQGIRENEKRMELLGYSVYAYKTYGLVIAGIIASIAGAFYVTYTRNASPLMIGPTTTHDAIFMVVLGGTGTLYGSVIGAVLYRFCCQYLGNLWDRWEILLGIIFVLMVIFSPDGFVGIVRRIKNWIVLLIKKSKESKATEEKSEVDNE